MHGGGAGAFDDDDRIDYVDFDVTKDLKKPIENHWFFWVFFPFKLAFTWLDPLMWTGFKRTLKLQDIPDLTPGNKVDKNLRRFNRLWKLFKKFPQRLFLSLYFTNFFSFNIAGLLQAFSACTMVFVPYLMKEFLQRLMPMKPDTFDEMLDFGRNVLPPEMQPDVSELFFRTNDYEVWLFLAGFGVAYFLSYFAQVYSFYMAMIVGMKQRAILTAALFQKSLKLSNKSRGEFETGTIINYISTDTLKVERINMMFHFGWTSIFTFAGAVYFLIDLIDWGTLSAIGTPFLTIPILFCCIFFMLQFVKAVRKVSDQRVKKVNEFLQGIKIIKFFTWEEPYLKVIKKVRAKEVLIIAGMSVFMSFLLTVFLSTPQIMSIAAFITYYFVHGYLDPITVFTSLSYINMLQAPVAIFPMMLIGLMECFISYGRIEKLLCAEELQPKAIGGNPEMPIVVKEGNFKWEAIKKPEIITGKNVQKKKKKDIELTEKPFELKNINLEVNKGELVMIVGKVGSGKSSLVQAILSEMRLVSGSVEITGDVAYCAQTPWIQNATLYDNIVFGKERNEEKFDEVVRVSSLTKDLEILKGGKNIEIGEKGINLSGGQKYRVSLARSVYSDAEIYILDDPLAAVDAHVGKEIFENCITGHLKEKTRILITHQIHICEKADKIILMEGGEIVEMGGYDELMKKGGKFFDLISSNIADDEDETEKVKKTEKKKEKKDDKNVGKSDLITKEEKAKGIVGFNVVSAYIKAGGGWIIFGLILIIFLINQTIVTGNSWFLSEWSAGTFSEEFGNEYTTNFYWNGTYLTTFNDYNQSSGNMWDHVNSTMWIPVTITAEVKSMNEPPVITYTNTTPAYYNTSAYNQSINEGCPYPGPPAWFNTSAYANGCPYPPPMDSMCIAVGGTQCFEYQVPVLWDFGYSNGTKLKDGLTQVESVAIYAGAGLGGILTTFIRDLIFSIFCLKAARVLHDKALGRVAFSPMSFFDTTPIGRILNRFSTDFEMLDFRIIRVLSSLVGIMLNCIGVFALMGYATNGLFLPFLIPLGVLYFLIYAFYRKSVIELKRLYSISKSPLLSHVTETLNGMPTIRAYGKVEEFYESNKKRIDINNCTYYGMMTSQRWLAIRLQFLGFTIIAAVSAICVCLVYYFEDWATSNLSYISMGVSYSLSVSMLLSMVFTQLTEAEVLLNSVERVDHYAKELEQEKDHEKENDPTDWPTKGEIRFKNYYMRYREKLPFVLEDVNCTIKPGEKVGVVGRTGAGKSSLMVALFRLVEPLNGTIYIDDVDISEIGLKTLRKNISIIPQDPVLFSGTIRSNMDPFNQYEDEVILGVLEKASLKEVAQRVGGLDATVQEGGENFSAGERQLLCLARALLKQSKVLILDECTASVDVQTDKVLQETIRQNKESTILTIAHRINTIIDYDRIMVMDKGRIAEFDSPKNLLLKEEYFIFKELIEETGRANSAFLKKVALGADVDIDEIISPKKEQIVIGEQKTESVRQIVDGSYRGDNVEYIFGPTALVFGGVEIEYDDVETFAKKGKGDSTTFEIGDGEVTHKCGVKKEKAAQFQQLFLAKMNELDDE